MSAVLIAVVAVLVLAQAAPSMGARVRRYGWFRAWLHWLDARTSAGATHATAAHVALAIAPPVIAAALLQAALVQPLLGLGGLLFDIAVLYYAWGPRDLDRDVQAVADAPDTPGRRRAAARLWPPHVAPVLEGGAL